MTDRKDLASEVFRLQAGGTLNPRGHVYIERPEDAEALHLLIAGEYVNILSSRQMGKSSLMVRIMRELRARGVRVATVDLAGEIGAPPGADSFYLSLLRCIARELVLDFASDEWWRERSSDTINRRFLDFFQTVVLAQVDGAIVVFLDEIDSTLRLRYTDDLFTAIRGIYNQRATNAVFERLTFCLLGVATPNELIKDLRTTPYNVGITIELRDFDARRDDLRALAGHLGPNPEAGAMLLERILHWTDGHPYLTIKLCAELAAIGSKTVEAVDRYVETAFTSLDRLSADAHFQQILRFFQTRLSDGRAALTLYRGILGGRREPNWQTTVSAELKLSGLVKPDVSGFLIVRNEIYRRLFDTRWAARAIVELGGRRGPAYASDTFEVGLALSGAVSAGAYTAGVLDFLLQALHEWEQARGEPGVPIHHVCLKVVAGASAGAITGALGVVALARGIQPQPFTDAELGALLFPKPDTSYQRLRCVLPTLYDTWVTSPRLVADRGIDLLSTEDLNYPIHEQALSLLNTYLLDKIKAQAIFAQPGIPPEAEPPYDYIAEKLHVYITVSNMPGIPVAFRSGNSPAYGMQTRGDRVHYVINDLGGWAGSDSDWVATDKSIQLSIATLPPPGSKMIPREWNEYGSWAFASSAFSLGLAASEIAQPIGQYEHRQYPMQVPDGFVMDTRLPESWLRSSQRSGYVFQNIDGSLIDNTPFEYAQYALMGTASAERRDGEDANAAVIIVSPFPEPPELPPAGRPFLELVSILREFFPALNNQAQFKASELTQALDMSDHSRFLIAPHRKPVGDALIGQNIEARYSIACGLLNGAGGFMNEKFRAHDFQLGRRNCQRFLQFTFGLPGTNPLFSDIKGNTWSQNPTDLTGNDNTIYPIIPLLGSAALEVPFPSWPRISQADFTVLMRRIKGRLSKLAPRFVQARTASRFFRALGRIGLFLERPRFLAFARLTILSDLIRRDQIEGWELPPMPGKSLDDVRLALAELANPAFTFRTAEGIAKRTHLEPAFVTSALAQLETVDDSQPFLVWQGKIVGHPVFTLASRKPGWLRSLPGISQFANLLEAPTID